MIITNEVKSFSFFLGGKAIFTIDNGKEGSEHKRFTYKIVKKTKDKYINYFVRLLTGSDNSNPTCYTYLGMLLPNKHMVITTRASKYNMQSPPVIALNWAMRKIMLCETFPGKSGVMHEGRCARCGRRLTVSESIQSGFGPECRELMGVLVPGPILQRTLFEGK